MINDLTNNLHISLVEGPDSLINFALSQNFDERLSLPRPGCRVWKDLEQQRVITSGSVVQLPEHLPKNGALGFLEYDVPKAAIVFERFLGAVAPGYLFGEPVCKVKISRGEMTVRPFGRQSNEG
jgi:hypothetical protein